MIRISTLVFIVLLASSCVTKDKGGKIDPLTSKALPQGMKLVWHDEFNDGKLDTTKWSTNYYSTFDYISKTRFEDYLADKLPQPAMTFTDSSIILYTDSDSPKDAYWLDSGRKLSSIQTYDWNKDKNLLGNKVGGYIEARIKRGATADAQMVNGAFWFDSPGPDARYYYEEGTELNGTKGIRPKGQIFEIDLCEYITTEIVLHGNVATDGTFKGNIGHYIHKGDFLDKWVIHSMLWTPSSLKFYIDGKLVKEWSDPNDIKSPNHALNTYLGMYGKDGYASLEADYIRYYQWELDGDNELPNPGFEYSESITPWEGDGEITSEAAHSGKHGVQLAANDSIIQYVYLDHSSDYQLKFWTKGSGNIVAKVENIKQVSGLTESVVESEFAATSDFSENTLAFSTGSEYADHKRTVKIMFFNKGSQLISLDDIQLLKK